MTNPFADSGGNTSSVKDLVKQFSPDENAAKPDQKISQRDSGAGQGKNPFASGLDWGAPVDNG